MINYSLTTICIIGSLCIGLNNLSAQFVPFFSMSNHPITSYYKGQLTFSGAVGYQTANMLNVNLAYSPFEHIGLIGQGFTSKYFKKGGLGVGLYLKKRDTEDKYTTHNGIHFDFYTGVEFAKHERPELTIKYNNYYGMFGFHIQRSSVEMSISTKFYISDIYRLNIYDNDYARPIVDEVNDKDPFIYPELSYTAKLKGDFVGCFIQFNKIISKQTLLFNNNRIFVIGGYFDISVLHHRAKR